MHYRIPAVRMLLWPSSTETSSIATPAARISTANVSRKLWVLHPSIPARPATRFSRALQKFSEVLGREAPVQK